MHIEQLRIIKCGQCEAPSERIDEPKLCKKHTWGLKSLQNVSPFIEIESGFVPTKQSQRFNKKKRDIIL